MNYRFIFLRRTIDLILMNFFFIKSNRFIFFNKIKKKKKDKYVFVELNLSNVLISLTYAAVSLFLSKKFQIIFYYYSKYDYIFKNKLFYFLTYNYIRFLKNNCNAEVINLFNKPNRTEKYYGNKIFKKIKNTNQLINLNYKGIDIGKYIFQSYSRELLKEQVDINDPKLRKFIIEAITYVNNLNFILKKKKIEKLFISHSIFIRYGILCKYFSKVKRSKIFILQPGDRLGNFFKNIDFIKLDSNYLVQMESYWNYKREFKRLKNKKKLLKISFKELNQRINRSKMNKHIMIGEINPYGKKKIVKFQNIKKDKMIILASNFFDSSFFYRNSLFIDSYTYTEKLLEIAKKTDFEWYIKPHPDGQPENEILIKKLKSKYPFLNILPRSISNKSFKINNFKSMFSFEGTAIHEFIFMGIPSYCVGDNKQSAYSFGKPSKNFQHFKKTILNANKSKKFNIQDVYEFNYMYTFQKSRDWISNYFLSKKERLHLENNYKGNFIKRYNSLKIFENLLKKKKLKIIKSINSL